MLRSSLLGVMAGVAVAGCSSDPVATPRQPAPGVEVLYGPAAETVLSPYPSNRYTVADASTGTGLRVQLGVGSTVDPIVLGYQGTIDQLNALDGFSTSGGAVATFAGPIDVRGLTRDPLAEPPDTTPLLDALAYTEPSSPLLIVDVDPLSSHRGEAVGIVPRYWAQPVNVDFAVPDYTLVAQPARPLRPGTRYLFAVTRRLRPEGDGELVRSADSEALLAGSAEGAYGDEVREALTVLEQSVGVAREDVVLATTFTTASVLDELGATAERARSMPAPALLEPFSVETELGADKRVRFRAVYAAPEYRRPKPDGKWQLEAGLPVEQAKVGLELFLAFADGTVSGPRPVVLFAHGLGGDKDGSWGTAERLADLGAAVIAIDSPEHGSRSDNPGSELASVFGFFGIDGESQTFDIGRARDNFRQMATDQLELVRLIASLGDLDLLPVGAPDGVPDLDVSHLLYIGHSFGSVQGPTLFALAPEVKQAVWNVGGDGLMTLLRDSNTFSILVDALRPPGTPDGAVARFFAIAQAIVDPGDPINYARFGTEEPLPGVVGWSARDVLLQEVIDDGIVPNSTSEALARAAGLELCDPLVPISGVATSTAPIQGNLASGATGVVYQFDRMNGGMPATHGELIFAPEAQAQYVEFFSSGLAADHATVVPAH